MLDASPGLSARELAAIAELERRTVEADGGRLKLEWGVLRSRRPDRVDDLLWWDGDRLLGFCGLYAFGVPDAELAGMVDPAARRRGIGRRLLAAALALLHERGYHRALLVTPRNSLAGRAFAIAHGATPHHSEHALVLSGDPADGPSDPAISVRPATPADSPVLSRLLSEAFGSGPSDDSLMREADLARTLVIERAGQPVGTLRVDRDDAAAGIYGFAVEPAWQGRGIGRDVLRRVCRDLLAAGATQVALEVAVDNEHALGLYTSLGFTQVTTEDYYGVPTSGYGAPTGG